MSKLKFAMAGLIATLPLLGQGVDPQPTPTPKPEPEKKPITVAWSDGKTSISGDLFLLRVSNRIQLRYTHESPDADVTLPGASEPGADRGSFRVRRAKLKLDGWVYSKRLEYKLQVNWPALSGTNPGAALEDAAINWDATGDQRLMLRFGQFKVPFGHQELTSSGSQQFVDRALVSNAFARGRDAGLAAWGRLGQRLEWRVGVFNGNGTTRTLNDNDAFQYDARVLIQPNGAVPLGQWGGGALHSESDFESKDKPLYAVALQFEHNDRSRASAGIDTRETTWGASGVFKYRGVFATAESFWRDSEPESGPGEQAQGWYAQAGVLLARRRVELGARYGRLDPSDLRARGEQTETGAVVAYVHRKHALKVQLDVRRLADDASDDVRHELRLQTQLAF